jgi:hypothetical protein
VSGEGTLELALDEGEVIAQLDIAPTSGPYAYASVTTPFDASGATCASGCAARCGSHTSASPGPFPRVDDADPGAGSPLTRPARSQRASPVRTMTRSYV